MNRGLKYCLFLISLLISEGAFSQIIFQPKPVEYNFKGVIYQTENVYDLRVTTTGFVVGYKAGKLKSYYNTSYYNFEIGYTKDPRERKQNKNEAISNIGLSSSFVYGKRNQMINLRVSAGGKHFLSEKTRRKGVAVGFIHEVGASIGLLKPVVLRIKEIDPSMQDREGLVDVMYSEETANKFLSYDEIFDARGFFHGIGSTSLTVGAHGKLAGHFALGAFEQRVKALEAGLMVDIFPGRVPILVEQEQVRNRFVFLNLYLSLQFGSRK